MIPRAPWPLSVLVALVSVFSTPAAEVVLEQIRSREHPRFDPSRLRLTLGRDGKVYLASGSNAGGYVLKMDLDGGNRKGGPVGPALGNATANADGVIATAHAHFSHRVTLHGPDLVERASLTDFLNNDTVGWSSPPHVEAGASGDFYALDHSRDRIVRLSATGRQVRAYPIPRRPAGALGRGWDFRVCEKTEGFYLLPQGGPLYRVGFDGKIHWVIDPKLDPGVRWGDRANAGGFDVDAAGRLYLLGPFSQDVRILSSEGTSVGSLTLKDGPPPARPGQADGAISGLRVHGDRIVVQRRHPTELFRTYDLANGKHRNVVSAQVETLRVRLPGRMWIVGEPLPLGIELERAGERIAHPPAWRVWLRSLHDAEYHELKWEKGRVTVPTTLGGVYVLRISPEVRPWQGATPPEYFVQTWIEVHQPGATGTLTLWTADHRARYALGEEIPVRLQLNPMGIRQPAGVEVLLRHKDSGRVLARENRAANPGKVVELTLRGSDRFPPGRYLLTATTADRTVAAQPLTLGPGRAGHDPAFFFMQYGDYRNTYPEADALDMAAVSAAHVRRVDRLGINLLVDRLGSPLQAGAMRDTRARQQLADLLAHLHKDGQGTAPASVEPGMPLTPTLAGYSARGIRQMAILMANDAGLPLGTGFDPRKPDQLDDAIRRVTTALTPFDSFRGWSWASNWWVFHERGARAARTPEEKKDYETALASAKKTGAWASVLDTVAARRLGLASEAQTRFRRILTATTKRRLVTASAAPYRNVESYPPISLANIDEVDLQAQWEQIAPPYVSAHTTDFYRRPGTRAWMHPEIWNDAGTGEQIVPTLFHGLMRGVDGVGFSGVLPPWAPRPVDPRHGHAGMVSVFRAMGDLVRRHGPWLRTLENADRVALVVSGRMLKIDAWRNVFGSHFARLLEAYCACLHAHHPMSIIFADDLPRAPRQLERFRAVLVVDQQVEMEPVLKEALHAARKAGVTVFHDGGCRPELVRDFTPLGITFDQFDRDRSPASDDSAYERFPRYCLAHVPAIRKALDPVARRVANVDNPEVFLAERRSGKGRYVFIVNTTTPELSPGQMWRMSLLVASRVPWSGPVDLGSDARHVYDIFAGRAVPSKGGVVTVDCRDLHGRILAILPAPVEGVRLTAPAGVRAGEPLPWTVHVVDADGKPLDASIPVRLRLLDPSGKVLAEEFAGAGAAGWTGRWRCPLTTGDGGLRLEAVELLTGHSVTVSVKVDPPRVAVQQLSVDGAKGDVGKRPFAPATGKTPLAGWQPMEQRFGPHVRDLAVSADGQRAFCNTFNWDHNLYAIDLKDGTLAWRQRVGNYFAFAPQATTDGLAVQGFDFHTAEGYHLYHLDAAGRPERRFALYGLPGRLPHRFVPALLGDRINGFASAPDGAWVASAGNLGLVVWNREGKRLWSQDWWKESRRTVLLAALGRGTLLVAGGRTLTAYDAISGKQLWQHILAASGEVQGVHTSADGRTCAVRMDADGGRVFVVRDGTIRWTVAAAADDLELSRDGRTMALTDGRQLEYYRDGALRWSLPGDDRLHHPRLDAKGQRIACISEMGTLTVCDESGTVLLERDLSALAVPAWLADGDLLLAGWMGTVQRLGPDFKPRWTTRLQPAQPDMRGKLLVEDRTPTARVTGWGNAEAKPSPITDNLLSPKTSRIEFRTRSPHVQLAHPYAALVDGKPDAPAEPWLHWHDVGWFAEGNPFTHLHIDTYRTRMRVEAITLVEDPKHPESWLRDARLEYWDASREEWRLATMLLSNQATHTHRLPKPVEAARWRITPSGLSGNLRLGEIVLHGKPAGPAHPDAAARRPVAVLFDEQDELKQTGFVGMPGVSFAFGGAYSGGRYLRLEGDRHVAAPFKQPFGHVVPTWDFEIVEKPAPGQYRYLQFAFKALAESSTGLTLRLDGDGYGRAVSVSAGTSRKEVDAIGKTVAKRAPMEWRVVQIDLWEVFGKPVRIRSLRLGAMGGPAGFDRILLGRTASDLPAMNGR